MYRRKLNEIPEERRQREREREREMVKKKKRPSGESQNTQCGNCYVITSTNEKTEMVRGRSGEGTR